MQVSWGVVASVLLAICILAGPVALGIVVAVYGLQLPRRRGLYPQRPAPVMAAMAAPTTHLVPMTRPSREFAVEPTVVVNADLDAVSPSAVHRPSRPELAVYVPAPIPSIPAARPATQAEPTTEIAASPLATQTCPTLAEPRPLPRRTAPPPLPRTRAARGTGMPPLPRAARGFAPEPTQSSAFDDCTDVDDVTRTDAPPWHSQTPARFAN